MVTIRVRNLQSIEDATLVVDGFTTITGTNNSGKTAVMRAVKGVFTNPPAAQLLRHGCDYFSVSLEFDDGTTVVWEKGWEKPDQRGKTINRYRVNGVLIEGVGSGVPPEVEALGVRSISAASENVWPQIAEQFDGTLFLVNRSGASVAEALSDVEKVGKLTSALKLAERDRRSCESELKIRRKDLIIKRSELSKYDGLDSMGSVIERLATVKAGLDADLGRISDLESLNSRFQSAKSNLLYYSGFDPDSIPDPARVVRMEKGVKKTEELHSRLSTLRALVSSLRDFEGIPVLDDSKVREIASDISRVESLNTKYGTLKDAVGKYSGFSVELPSDSDVSSLHGELNKLESLLSRFESSRAQILDISNQESELHSDVLSQEAEISAIIGDNGFCPVCNSVHVPGSNT